MTDPITLAVAFSRNLKAKNGNTYQKYSGHLKPFSKEYKSRGP